MILITGATGFIGQHVVAWLSSQQQPICCLVHPSRRVHRFAPGVITQIVSGNVDDPPALRVAMQDVTAVIHLAGVRDESANQTFEAINVQGTQNVIEAMREAEVVRLIVLSPIGADSHSAYPYLRSQGQVGELVRQSGLNYSIIQSGRVYGSGDRWTEVIALALRRLPFFFPMAGDGHSRMQPIFVNDLLNCFHTCLTDPQTLRQTYVVGGPQHMTFEEVVKTIMEATRHHRRIRYMRPSSARSFAGTIRGLLSGYLLYTDTDLDLLAMDRTTTLDAVAYQFGFTPARMSAALDYLQRKRSRYTPG